MSQRQTQRTLVGGIRRPAWITRQTKQRAVLVRDASSSMAGAKSSAADAAVSALMDELASSLNKDGFRVAVIDFAEGARVERVFAAPARPPALRADGGRTNVTAALELAAQCLARADGGAEPETSWLRPVAILFTDGCHNHGGPPDQAAARLKEIADVVTIAFGDDADEALLAALATSPQHSRRCRDGRELRELLARVGATMTATMAMRTNAGAALAQLPKP